MKLIPTVLLSLFCVTAQAQWTDKSGNQIPDSDDQKSNGRFIAQLVFVTNEQEFFKKWSTPSESVYLETVDAVSINRPISSFIIFGGCKPDAAGNCNVTMRFRVTQPDGKVYSETPMMEVWRGKKAPPNLALEASVDYLKVIVEPHEQRGNYVVMVEVTDHNSGAVLHLKKQFAAKDQAS